jgi:hypothetical protein
MSVTMTLGAAVDDPAVALGEAAQRVETSMRAAEPAIARFALRWHALRGELGPKLSYARKHPELFAGAPAQLANVLALAEQLEQSYKRALAWGGALRDLDTGRAHFQPYTLGGDPEIRFGVAPGGTLGWVAVAWKVITFATGAALAAWGFKIADALTETAKVYADATVAEAQFWRDAMEIAKADPRLAPIITQAKAKADRAALDPRNWVDKLLGGVGAGFGGAGLLVLLYLFTRSRRSAPAKPAPTPYRDWWGRRPWKGRK